MNALIRDAKAVAARSQETGLKPSTIAVSWSIHDYRVAALACAMLDGSVKDDAASLALLAKMERGAYANVTVPHSCCWSEQGWGVKRHRCASCCQCGVSMPRHTHRWVTLGLEHRQCSTCGQESLGMFV